MPYPCGIILRMPFRQRFSIQAPPASIFMPFPLASFMYCLAPGEDSGAHVTASRRPAGFGRFDVPRGQDRADDADHGDAGKEDAHHAGVPACLRARTPLPGRRSRRRGCAPWSAGSPRCCARVDAAGAQPRRPGARAASSAPCPAQDPSSAQGAMHADGTWYWHHDRPTPVCMTMHDRRNRKPSAHAAS